MTMKIKKHTTVTITKKLLAEAGACESGVEDASPFLPAKISTNPDENLDLAIALVEANVADRTRWLQDAFMTDADCTCEYCLPRLYNSHHDVSTVAQSLAAVADVLATKEGR